jgi:hypothetical protein
VGLGNAIATAEYLIVNENSKDETEARVRETLHKVEEKWKK